MAKQQEFWETLKLKYEEKNRALQQKEQELRLKLEAMDAIIGTKTEKPTETLPLKDPEHIFGACTCPPPQDKGGFFKCVFSLFGTSKPKTPPAPIAKTQSAPRAPQDVPTKEITGSQCIRSERVRTVVSQKDENCMCNPCQLDHPPEGGPKSQDCNCSICSSSSVVPTNTKCTCDPSNADNCICTEEELPKGSIDKIGLGSPSKLSLKSMDLFYMQNIHELAAQQKKLLHDIRDLEQKNKIYDDVFDQYKNIDFSAKAPQASACCPCNDSSSQSDQKTNAELKLENFLLKNELKDMRLEVRQYLERMEGPMQFKIESERYKCFQLEQKLEEAAKEQANIQEFYQKEINSLKMQMCTANTNIYNLTATNEQLMEALQGYQSKCVKLEEDLIRQKISEAETIKSLQDALNAQINANVQKDECDLHQIARELSKVLKECEPCGDCLSLPEDLTAAAKLLKSLTDIIENKIPKEGTPSEEPVKTEDVLETPVTQTEDAVAAEAEPPRVEEVPSELPPMEEFAPVKTSSRKSSMEEKSQKSEKSVVISEPTTTEEKPEEPDTPAPQPPKSKTSCKCVKSKKSSDVDQIWPKSEGPVVMKDSSVMETTAIPSKKKCTCHVTKKSSQQVTPTGSKRSCKCNKKSSIHAGEPAAGTVVTPVWPSTSERFKLAHQVTASKSKELLKSETSVKCLKVKENFPFDIDTQVDVLNRPPDGVHVTTTITNSGTLEVITEGPEGVIETTLIYTNSGNVEVVTEIQDYKGKGKACNRNKIKTPAIAAASGALAIEAPPTVEQAEALPSPASEQGKPPAEDTPKSSLINANCQCKQCPVLEADVAKMGEEMKEILPVPAEAPPVEDVPENAAPEAPVENVTSIEATLVETSADVPDSQVAKSLSLSMHVENESDLEKIAPASEESNEA
ncbi:uncharacterized protein LOC658548 isoform X2 [Tribolium castaneum]|uniref:uncharacterized protein LOC658548 isoform X2 n=1 Tax=Tribolium castaneum TaxID=7070 RepID=UPI00077D9F02|nr:PREDICTED: uncharacterized protein LOC658548 isoform X2 [Tribolium castaneum]|eukprot:XP_015833907.1 PREDICTED: uncharacterized protein LOC658548 isoform X2 [Tribolium castaneum]